MNRITLSLVAILFGVLGCSKKTFETQTEEKSFLGGAQYNSKVDILWVVDNSSSMAQHQSNITKQANVFFNDLLRLDLDFRVSAITTDVEYDRGELIGPILSPTTKDLKNKFKLLLSQGEDGSNLEKGLKALGLFIENEYSEKASFLRSDALLVLIFLSNEDDFSEGEPGDYANAIELIKGRVPGHTKGWVANFIGIIESQNPACSTRNDTWSLGSRYLDLVDLSGGTKTSICTDDFSLALGQIQKKVIALITDYRIDSLPLVESIRVTINKSVVPESDENGWKYIEDEGVIRFSGTWIPKPQDKVDVTYKPKL